jgi:sigma-E factor negative regulatory protein RseC
MIEEEGIVMETRGEIAKIAILTKSACEKCASADTCHPEGPGSLMEAANPLNAKKGQKVKVILAPQVYLKAAIIIYGIPVAAFLAAAIIAKKLTLGFAGDKGSDLWAFIAGSVCLAVSFFFIRRYNNKVEKTQEYKPMIVEILGD